MYPSVNPQGRAAIDYLGLSCLYCFVVLMSYFKGLLNKQTNKKTFSLDERDKWGDSGEAWWSYNLMKKSQSH